MFSLFFYKNICYGYSIEASNEYLEHMLLWRNKKNIYLAAPLIWNSEDRIEDFWFQGKLDSTVLMTNQSTDSTGGLIVSECRRGKWS